MKLPHKGAFLQFIKFCLVGVSNTLISLAVYYVFVFIDERLYLAGNVAGWIVSVANAFFWNNRYVFSGKDKSLRANLKKLGKTYLSYGVTFLLSTVLLYVEVDLLHLSVTLSPLFNLLITIPANFFLNKYWTFR